MVDEEDWRLTGQDETLARRPMRWSRWFEYRPGWDHDHCEFCWAKFGPEVTDEVDHDHGWLTADDGYNWVCPPCFADFRERFQWTVEGSEPSP